MAKFDQYRRLLKRFAIRAVCLFMVAAAVWGGGWVPNAHAVGSERAAEIMQNRAAAELDRMAGNKSEIDPDVDLDKAGRELKGKVNSDVRKTKSKAAKLGDDVEDAAGNLVDPNPKPQTPNPKPQTPNPKY